MGNSHQRLKALDMSPRITVHSIDDAPESSRGPLRAAQRRYGKVLNIHGAMAHAPVVLSAYTGIQQAIAAHGSFDPRVREAIALAVANADDCDYCQSAHTVAAQAAGWTAAETVAIRAGGPLDGHRKLEALLAVARETALAVGDVDESTWRAAREAGWTDTELAELFAHVMANVYTNYFNHYAHTELDIPAAPGISSATP
ncbi:MULTISPECIES: carboxymuconolactone decarboxylase family protein [unclassified Nocardia]|uniref:carboxymuconolactone decarboxylase family protein n=1 Tax=unclassified Nocardia TaxID=2637762 RepID=UPI00278C5A5B|nr:MULTISPECIES: carboxymuconolactone decarboxylase family protein [unclassified Nocardia]